MSLIILVSVFLLQAGCTNPLGPDTNVEKDFHPGISLSLEKSVVSVSTSAVQSGETVTLTAQIKDQNGNPYTDLVPVKFKVLGGTGTGEISDVTYLGNGLYTATFSAMYAGSALTVYASASNKELVSPLPTLTVVPGVFSLAYSIVTVSTASIDSGNTSTVTLTAKDAQNNQLSTGGLTVNFSTGGGGSTGTFSAVTDHGDGTYSASFQGVVSGSATNIQAQIHNMSVTSGFPTIAVNPGPASQLVFSQQPTNAVNELTISPAISVVAKDANNNTVISFATNIVMSVTTNPGGSTLSGSLSQAPSSGIATFNNLSLNLAGSGYQLKATAGALTATSSTFNIISYKPSAVSVSTDRPLEYFTLDLSTGITPTYTAGIVTENGATPAIGGNSYSGSGAGTNGGDQPAPGGSSTGSGFTPINAYTPFTATATVSSTFPTGASGACNVQPPYNSISCFLTNFSITSSNLTTTGALTVRAYASNGGSLDYLYATSIPVKRKVIEKFMDGGTGYYNFTDMNYYRPENGAVSLNGNLYFTGPNEYGVQKLFVTNGTTITQLPSTSGDPTLDDYPFYLTVFNNLVYFVAYNSNSNPKLYVTNGVTTTQVSNTSGTQTLSDFIFSGYSSIKKPVVFNNKLYIQLIVSPWPVTKLFTIDASGTLAQFSDTRNNNAGSDNIGYLINFGSNLYFGAGNAGNYNKLFKTDGTSIINVSDTRNSVIAGDAIKYPIASSNALYFWANNATNIKTKLYKTDGSAVTPVSDTVHNANASDFYFAGESISASIGSDVYFWAYNASNAAKVFKTNGTTVTQVSNTSGTQTAFDALYATPMQVFNNEVYFLAGKNATTNYKLFKTDGTTTTQISNTINDNLLGDLPNMLGVYDGDLYFTAKNPSGFKKLYKTDGTNVVQVMDLYPGNHDFDGACGGYGTSFWVLGAAAYITVVDNNTCTGKLMRIRPL